MDKDKHQYSNRLVDESSPYLLQHAHNPVNWYPWCEDAFAKAKAEDKPIFLSIGYSTCHWCHVMEHESFADETVAAFLNEHYVSIKLDREQRPDLDDIYMTGVQIVSGQGGWPMSNFLTWEGKPFFAGTYYPKQNFLHLLTQLREAWDLKRVEVVTQSEKISHAIAQFTAASRDAKAILLNLEHVAASALVKRLDREHGGFGGAPKFPNESQVLLVLSSYQRQADNNKLEAARLCMDKMYQGGIFDQIAGGFHRYTVDADWLTPHFEKMLYNQALLLRVYSEGFAVTGDNAYLEVITETITYLVRDMRREDGLFYSATDADSEGEEGKFFVWDKAELSELLSVEDFELISSVYGVTAAGNFEGANILNLSAPFATYAADKGIEYSVFKKDLDRIKAILRNAREQRIHPLRDEKIITAWNAMLISALTFASMQTDETYYLELAALAAENLWRNVFDEKNNTENSNVALNPLWRITLDGSVSIPANLEDYAYFSEALFSLYHLTAKHIWLQRAVILIAHMRRLFWDEKEGGFFLSLADDVGPLITRPKSPMDGAIPSANSTALMALVLLFEATGDREIEGCINTMIKVFGGLVSENPMSFSAMVVAIERKRLGAMSSIQFSGEGHIRLIARYRGNETILTINVAAGWHINAHSNSLLPTEVEAAAEVLYPEGVGLDTGGVYTDKVYTGSVEIVIKGRVPSLKISLQACSENICLAPEVRKLNLAKTIAT